MDIKRIYDFVAPPVEGGSCWNWTRAINNKGYGVAYFLGRQTLAHRLSYEVSIGPIPEGMFVLHRCDNPRCINPSHLFAGTQLDNVRDAMAKKRHVYPPKNDHYRDKSKQPRGSKNPASKLTEETAKEILIERLKGRNFVDLGKEFGVDPSIIADLCRGATWKHVHGVDGSPTLEQLTSVPIRYNWTDPSFRRQKVDAIKPKVLAMLAEGKPAKDIMRETGVTKPVLYRIKKGER
jgi:hypothetical protein